MDGDPMDSDTGHRRSLYRRSRGFGLLVFLLLKHLFRLRGLGFRVLGVYMIEILVKHLFRLKGLGFKV